MTIEDYIKNMLADLKQGNHLPSPQPSQREDIERGDQAFYKEFGFVFPESYKKILLQSNGIIHNGLIIWPLETQPYFEETIFQANRNLNESFSNDFIYFAQMDEELYVYSIEKKQFCAIEFIGKEIWKIFSNEEDMFIFALNRAWE